MMPYKGSTESPNSRMMVLTKVPDGQVSGEYTGQPRGVLVACLSLICHRMASPPIPPSTVAERYK
jgi:hypothetical protein